MDIQLIKRERKGDIIWLTLDSPGNMNALSLTMLEALNAAIDSAYEDETARCVVITGTGKAFCAGGDLRGFQADLAEPTTDRFLHRLRYAQVVFDKIERLPMPVIAAVNGYAIAGGLELILCCDMIVAAESAMIGDGHAKYGIIPAGGSSARLPRKISANRANFMLLAAELLPAKTLEQWGLVNAVVPDAELQDAVTKLSDSIAAHSPLGLKIIKSLVQESTKIPVEDAARAEITAFEKYAESHDFSEGLAAFIEKRKPAFIGK